MREWELEEQAAAFWAGTDLADAFPRNIEQAIALKLPVTVVKLPVVTVQDAGQWLQRHHRRPVFPSYRRDLMGCLYADGGHGFIFLCGADEPEEQRFTLAHDTAHFLVDYLWPRQRVIQALGPSILGVLDGQRCASPQEQAAAILGHVRLGPHWHLLPRPGSDPADDGGIGEIEDRADQLGLELIAPYQRVIQILREAPVRDRSSVQAACAVLSSFFGLPPYVFGAIVAASQHKPAPSFLDDARRFLGR